MQFVQVNGCVIHYQIIGHESGKPVLVFANSLGTDFRIWRDVVVALAGDFTILNYDMRGHGLSDVPAGPYSLDDHVQDVAGLLDYLKLDNALVCGLSVGGLIAQGLYHARPDLVRGLILCDTATKLGDPEMWSQRMEAAEADGLASIADGIMERWFTKDFITNRKLELAGYRNMLSQQPVEGYVGIMATLRDTDITDKCAAISCPTICVVGSQDVATTPELVESMAALIPGAEFELIAGSGHIPCVEQPEALVAVIRNFAAEATTARTLQ